MYINGVIQAVQDFEKHAAGIDPRNLGKLWQAALKSTWRKTPEAVKYVALPGVGAAGIGAVADPESALRGALIGAGLGAAGGAGVWKGPELYKFLAKKLRGKPARRR